MLTIIESLTQICIPELDFIVLDGHGNSAFTANQYYQTFSPSYGRIQEIAL